MGDNKLPGSGWHITTLHMNERDDRRHKSRCIYYSKINNHCSYRCSKCIGSAHCLKYKEQSQNSHISSQKVDHQTIHQKSKWYVGAKVKHTRYGSGVVVEIDEQYISVSFTKDPPAWYGKKKRKKKIKHIVKFEFQAAKDGAIVLCQ